MPGTTAFHRTIPSILHAINPPVSSIYELFYFLVNLIRSLARAVRRLTHRAAQEGGSTPTTPGNLPHLLAHAHAGHHKLSCPGHLQNAVTVRQMRIINSERLSRQPYSPSHSFKTHSRISSPQKQTHPVLCIHGPTTTTPPITWTHSPAT